MPENSYRLPTNDHVISLETAVEMTQRYRAEKQSLLVDPTDETILPVCETFSRDAVLNLLNTAGAAAFRIYYGMTVNQNIHAILVAVAQNGSDILPAPPSITANTEDDPTLLEDGQRCPYTCPPESPLNT